METLYIISEAFRLFFEDDEEEEEEDNELESSDNNRNQNYIEEFLPRLSDQTFKLQFRINADVFDVICNEIYSMKNYGTYSGYNRSPYTLKKQVMITLAYLGNQESMKQIAKRFDTCVNTVWRTAHYICDLLLKLNKQRKFIKWPDPDEAKETSDHFLKNGFPGVIGCIGRCHIPIKPVITLSNSYINNTGFHSVLMQGICNHKLEFTYCYTGEPGALCHEELLDRSGLIDKIECGKFNVNDDEHLLGNSSYPLKDWLLTPFIDFEHLKEDEEIFNGIHSLCNDVIKRAFGILKGRFRRLFYVNSMQPTAVVTYIIAACILHNICMQNNDSGEEYSVVVDDDKGHELIEIMDDDMPSLSAQKKRFQIMNSLF